MRGGGAHGRPATASVAHVHGPAPAAMASPAVVDGAPRFEPSPAEPDSEGANRVGDVGCQGRTMRPRQAVGSSSWLHVVEQVAAPSVFGAAPAPDANLGLPATPSKLGTDSGRCRQAGSSLLTLVCLTRV